MFTNDNSDAWEYKAITVENWIDAGQLTSIGNDGWLLVGFVFSPESRTGEANEHHYVFKRPQK